MELQQILEKRQSIRRYKEGDIPEEDIREIVEAAASAPSGKNIQNWHFVAIKNRTIIEKIKNIVDSKNESICNEMAKVDEEKANRFRKFCKNFTLFFANAPVLTVVYSTVYTPSGYNEYKLINADSSLLDDLLSHRNPGMQSVGAALENFTLKAIDKGYGTCWLTSANYAAAEIEKVLKEEVGFEKDGFFMVALMSMGIPEDNQKSPAKKALEDVYTFID
ncbi:MAG: nitroreductase family protein [Eubacteriales bacterium]|nr:nitroreductase family protein [Eubacteriales bacterium]